MGKHKKTYSACGYNDSRCYECDYFNNESQAIAPTLASNCVVMESLICSKSEYVIAELAIPVVTLGDIISIGPGGLISPLVTLIPDINGIISQTTVVKDMVIITGYLPANITILGIETPLQLNIPFQAEINCPGVCPEDTINVAPFKIEGIVTQGIEALGVNVANILFKVILSTTVTATRPVIVKSADLQVVKDVNEDRCEQSGCNG